jgi:hypothetical protein
MQQSEKAPTIIHWDNMSTIPMTKNSMFHSRTRHIELRHHFIRKLVQEGEIQLEFLNTNEQLPDLFTKVVTSEKFVEFKKNMRITN